jgi:hypothetical protein
MLSQRELRMVLARLLPEVRAAAAVQLSRGRVYEATRILAQALADPRLAADVIATIVRRGSGWHTSDRRP